MINIIFYYVYIHNYIIDYVGNNVSYLKIYYIKLIYNDK